MVTLGRATCTHTWSDGDGEYEAVCERYAIVSVNGEKYCEKHAQFAPTSDT